MIAAGVNIHHFILDGAIWKLRDTGVGGVLLAEAKPGTEGGAASRSEHRLLVPLGWMAAIFFTALSLYGAAEEFNWQNAVDTSKLDRARGAASRSAEQIRASNSKRVERRLVAATPPMRERPSVEVSISIRRRKPISRRQPWTNDRGGVATRATPCARAYL